MTTLEPFPQGTVEYVKAPVTGDVEFIAQTVVISVDGKVTWLPAQWIGTDTVVSGLHVRTARTTSPVTFSTKGVCHVYVKVTDSPEIPIMKAGEIPVK